VNTAQGIYLKHSRMGQWTCVQRRVYGHFNNGVIIPSEAKF